MLKVDRRIRKSQEAIKKAVIDLMVEKKFDHITIQDISDRADVSRRTIHLHYTDKFDLLDQLIEEHIDNLRKICDSADDDADYKEMALVWFEHFENHSMFFSALLASKGSSFFRDQFLTFFIEELEKGSSMSEERNPELRKDMDVDIQFLGSAIVGVVEWWFKQGKPLAPSSMAQRVGVLLERNLEV